MIKLPFPKTIIAADGKRVKIYYIKENDGCGVFLNHQMLKDQKCTSADIREILFLAKEKANIYKEMMYEPNSKALRAYARILTQIEYNLQTAWHFRKNKKFHRFWEMPQCKCPKIDNSDAWPTGYYTISGECVIHGYKLRQGPYK